MQIEEKTKELRGCFENLFGDNYLKNCYIETNDNAEEIVLLANHEGLLLMIEELMKLYKKNDQGTHFHLDEYGMATKCDTPLVVTLANVDSTN